MTTICLSPTDSFETIVVPHKKFNIIGEKIQNADIQTKNTSKASLIGMMPVIGELFGIYRTTTGAVDVLRSFCNHDIDSQTLFYNGSSNIVRGLVEASGIILALYLKSKKSPIITNRGALSGLVFLDIFKKIFDMLILTIYDHVNESKIVKHKRKVEQITLPKISPILLFSNDILYKSLIPTDGFHTHTYTKWVALLKEHGVTHNIPIENVQNYLNEFRD